jgi:hypothetical protein
VAKSRNKRKKKKQQSPVRVSGVEHSKSYLDTCHATARRIIRAIGEDEALFDIFTKRQKQGMFIITITPPYITALSGHKVPKQFLRYIQNLLTGMLKREYFDKESKTTWMDVATVGKSLLLSFMSEAFTDKLQPHQLEVSKRLLAAFETKNIFTICQARIVESIRVSLMSLSQPNFRTYGLAPVQPIPEKNRPVIQRYFCITTHECQTLHFKYRNYERIAFRVFLGPIGDAPASNATLAMSKLFPGIKHDRQLDIYIQSHAIRRLKERLDTMHPAVRTDVMHLSLAYAQQIIRIANGRMYITCIMPDSTGIKAVGYFAFTIDGNNLLILTFLPLLSPHMPEGQILSERLHLSHEDLIYLGMDKLSFFYDVDIEQIPALKRVLFDELHLDYVHKLYNSTRQDGESFSEKKTTFVKNFFREIEDRLLEPVDEQEAPSIDKQEITPAIEQDSSNEIDDSVNVTNPLSPPQ